MSELVESRVEMRYMECGECGITFWAPERFMQERSHTGKNWFCPNGHSRVFRETDSQKLQKQLDEEMRRRASAESEAEWQRGLAKNAQIQATKAKNKLRKIETRVNAGVCPHCNRTFKQLVMHMHAKHPDLEVSA